MNIKEFDEMKEKRLKQFIKYFNLFTKQCYLIV